MYFTVSKIYRAFFPSCLEHYCEKNPKMCGVTFHAKKVYVATKKKHDFFSLKLFAGK